MDDMIIPDERIADMDANLLKYMAFIKTVEYGSFTRAAEILHYSQSGISRMIHDLEKEWNVTLLERSRTGVRLTTEGEMLLPGAKSLCEEYQKLQMRVDDLHGLQTGMIRIGTFSSAATYWLPNIIKAFQKDYPGIRYELLLGDYQEIETWIAEGRVDCGFLRLPTRPEFEIIPLERDDFLAVLPEGHPLAALEKVPIVALCEEPFILLEQGENVEGMDVFTRYGLTPKVHCSIWEDYAVMSMVEIGLGVSILPRLILQRIPYRIVAKELNVPAYRDIVFCLRDKDSASLAVTRFLDYLVYRNPGSE